MGTFIHRKYMNSLYSLLQEEYILVSNQCSSVAVSVNFIYRIINHHSEPLSRNLGTLTSWNPLGTSGL